MHSYYVQERLAIDVPAGAGGSGHGFSGGCSQARLDRVGDGRQRLALFGYARGLEIGFAAHDSGYAGGVVSSGVAVVGESGGH